MTYFSTALLLGGLLVLASTARAQISTFAPATAYSSGGDAPSNIAVADINGDGKPDLLLSNSIVGTVGVLLNSGNGAFQPATTYFMGVGTHVASLAVADVNHDSKPDLLATDFAAGAVGVLLGSGNGTFQTVTRYSTAPAIIPYDIAVADVNGDSHPDLVLGAYAGSSMTSSVGVLLGNGTGSFRPVVTFASSNHLGIAVADVNGDGKQDVLTASITSSSAGVLVGNGNGTLQPEVAYDTGSNSTPHDVAVADVNADGQPDLVTANYSTSTVGVLLNAGHGVFQPVTTYSTGNNSSPEGIAVADVNGDGLPDLLTANYYGDAVGVLLGAGNGSFQAVTTYSTNYGGHLLTSPFAIVATDINGDGKPDLLTANRGDDTAGVLFNTATPLATRAALLGATATLAPNPASDHATLSLAGLSAAVVRVQVILLDATGRAVARHTLAAAQGSARTELPTAALAAGLYVLRLEVLDAQGQLAGSLPAQRLSIR